MPRAVSLGRMIEQLEGLLGTDDLTIWQQGFVANVVQRYRAAGRQTTWATERQAETIEQLWNNHFA